MSTLTIDLPGTDVGQLQMLTVAATELRHGDLIGRDGWSRIVSAYVDDDSGIAVTLILETLGGEFRPRPGRLAGDVQVAILRPVGGAS